jgi:hypothetical protein
MSTRSFILITLFISLLSLSTLIHPAFSQQLGYVENNDVILVFDYRLKKMAEEIQKFYPQVKHELEEKIGWRISYQPRIIIYRDNRDFQRTVNNPYILAYAVPAKRLMVIDNSKMNIDPFKLETTIKHELCHLILHEHIQKPNLPRWVDEGIAQWVSGGIGEVIFQDRGSLLDSAILSGRFIPLRSLQYRFPSQKRPLLLAYEQSRSAVDFMIKKYGEEGLRNLLQRLKNGHPIEVALHDEFGTSFPDFEAEWKDHLRKKAVWLTYIISHLYELLFILGGLLLCYGFIKIWLKKRSMMDEYSDD